MPGLQNINAGLLDVLTRQMQRQKEPETQFDALLGLQPQQAVGARPVLAPPTQDIPPELMSLLAQGVMQN